MGSSVNQSHSTKEQEQPRIRACSCVLYIHHLRRLEETASHKGLDMETLYPNYNPIVYFIVYFYGIDRQQISGFTLNLNQLPTSKG